MITLIAKTRRAQDLLKYWGSCWVIRHAGQSYHGNLMVCSLNEGKEEDLVNPSKGCPTSAMWISRVGDKDFEVIEV